MDINKENLMEKVKVELTEEYMKKIVREYITMSQEAIKYIPKDTKDFKIEEAFYQYTKLDSSNKGLDISEKLQKLNQKILQEAFGNNTLILAYQNGYQMNPITSNQIGWYTYQSWHLTNQKRTEEEEISHRFYINANSKIMPELMETIYNYYKEKNGSFYFKASANSEQGWKDNIVIYSSTKELDNTLEVLKKLEENHPELIKDCRSPHLFTASINNWVGYAAEPKKGHTSYTKLIAKIMTTALESGVSKWIHQNSNQTISMNGKNIKLSDYFSKDLYENKNFSEQRQGYAEYIKRLGILLNTIPKMDSNFKNLLFDSIKDEIKKNHISIENIGMNSEVKAELENSYHLPHKDTFKSQPKSNLDTTLYPQYDFSFGGLKRTYDNYLLSRDENNKLIAVERNSDRVITDSFIINRLKFAMTWFDANSVKSSDAMRNYSIGSTEYQYSFEAEGAKEVYQQLMDIAKEQILTEGTINLAKINNSISVNYKYTHEIIDNISSQQRYQKALETWVTNSIQHTSYSSINPVSSDKQALESMLKDYGTESRKNNNTKK